MSESPSILQIVQGNLEYFQNEIKERRPFSFVRYGDGEFASIFGQQGSNCDGVKYTHELQFALTETLRYPHLNDNYHYGILAIALRTMRQQIEKFVRANNLELVWTEATFLVAANRTGKLAEFLGVMRQCPIIYVAPDYLRKVTTVPGLKIKQFITVPERGAFEQRYFIADKILEHANKSNFIGLSCGPATKWLIWSLFPEIGQTHTLFDFGSIFDGYVGRLSRMYHKRPAWIDAQKSNLSC